MANDAGKIGKKPTLR